MNLSPDAFWDWMKVRYPRLAHWDVIRDTSHLHHLVVTTLVFGGWGLFVSLILWTDFNYGFAKGVLGGTSWYICRESWSRIQGRERKPYERWDGKLDVYLQFACVDVLAIHILWPSQLTGLLFYACLGLCAWLYTFGRPPHTVFYEQGAALLARWDKEMFPPSDP